MPLDVLERVGNLLNDHNPASCLMFIGVISLESPSKRRLAMITFEASDGWYGSQNTYLDLSLQTFDGGPQGIKPPKRPTR